MPKIQASNLKGKLKHDWNKIADFNLTLTLGRKHLPGKGILEVSSVKVGD